MLLHKVLQLKGILKIMYMCRNSVYGRPTRKRQSKGRDGGRYFSKVTSYLLLITSHNVTRYSYILL